MGFGEVKAMPFEEEPSAVGAIGVFGGMAGDVSPGYELEAFAEANLPSPLKDFNGGGIEVR